MSRIGVAMPAAVAVGLSFGVLLSGSVPTAPVLAQSQGGAAEAAVPPPQVQAQEGTGQERKKKRSGGGGGSGGSGTLVFVDRVKVVPMAQTLPLVGRLVAMRAGVVASRIDAPVAEMRAEVGDPVRKGDVLAILVNDRRKWDREQKAAELAGTEAAVATARARLALADQELKRFLELQTSAAFPKARYEDKRLEVMRLRTEIVEAEARAERARAVLKLAETELSHTRIVAPYDGTITRRHVEVGGFIKEAQAIYSMVSDRDMEVEVDVPSARVAALPPGTVATFELAGIGAFEAAVRAVVPEEDPRTRTRTVRFTPRFDTRPALIAANQSATVHVPIGGGRNVLSVHKDGVLMLRGAATAFVVENGEARARPVLIGEAVGSRFEVLEGLRDGDIVITRGNDRLRDGERVQYDGVATQ